MIYYHVARRTSIAPTSHFRLSAFLSLLIAGEGKLQRAYILRWHNTIFRITKSTLFLLHTHKHVRKPTHTHTHTHTAWCSHKTPFLGFRKVGRFHPFIGHKGPQGEQRYSSTLFQTAALEGGEGSASHPGSTLPPGKTRYPLYRRLGGSQGRSGQVRKISPHRPVHRQSLYRLRYPAHGFRKKFRLKFYFEQLKYYLLIPQIVADTNTTILIH